MRRLIEAMNAVMEADSEAANAGVKKRASRAAVEKMLSAMMSAPQVRTRAVAVVGRDADVDSVLGEIELALYPAVVMALQKAGIKVSGESESAIKQSIRAGL